MLGGFGGIEGDGGAVGASGAAAGEFEALFAGEAGGGVWVGADESEDATELDTGAAFGSSPSLNAFEGAS